MEKIENAVVEEVVEEKIIREYTEEELTRTFTLSEASYKILMEVVDEADSRGLNSSAQYWLERHNKSAANVNMRLWKKADDQSIFAEAQRGSKSAKLAVLSSVGVKTQEDLVRLLESLKKK